MFRKVSNVWVNPQSTYGDSQNKKEENHTTQIKLPGQGRHKDKDKERQPTHAKAPKHVVDDSSRVKKFFPWLHLTWL